MVTRVRTGPTGQPRRRRITCHARPDERGWRCVPMATGFGQRWPLQQLAAPAGSTPCQQGAQRVGRRPVWPGEGWQHGSGRPRGQVKPPLRAAAPTRPPALASLAAAARWQPGPAAAAPESPGPGAQWPLAPPGGALRLDRRPTGRGPPAVGACGTSGQPLLPPTHHPTASSAGWQPYER